MRERLKNELLINDNSHFLPNRQSFIQKDFSKKTSRFTYK